MIKYKLLGLEKEEKNPNKKKLVSDLVKKATMEKNHASNVLVEYPLSLNVYEDKITNNSCSDLQNDKRRNVLLS